MLCKTLYRVSKQQEWLNLHCPKNVLCLVVPLTAVIIIMIIDAVCVYCTLQVGRAGHLSSPGYAVTFINNECKSIFADFVDLLRPLGVQFPPQLINSPHLRLQEEQRKRKSSGTNKGGALHRSSKKRKLIDTEYCPSQERLIDLIKSVKQHSHSK